MLCARVPTASPDRLGDQPRSRYARHVHVFVFESLVMTLAFYALMAVKVWAFVDALIRPAAGYVAAEKLTKPVWLVILGVSILLAAVLGGIFGAVICACAAGIYMVDVRPKLLEVQGKSR